MKTWFTTYIPTISADELSLLEQSLYAMYYDYGITELNDPRKMRNEDFPIMEDLYKTIEKATKERTMTALNTKNKRVINVQGERIPKIVNGNVELDANGYYVYETDTNKWIPLVNEDGSVKRDE